jgi:RHS repeat-associated protein
MIALTPTPARIDRRGEHPKTHGGERRLQQPGLRYYNSELGRWINRDPIGELSSRALYVSCVNACANVTDFLGLMDHPGGGGGSHGFFVVGDELEDAGEDDTPSEAVQRHIGKKLPCDKILHTDVYYGGRQIRYGFGGGSPLDVAALPEEDISRRRKWTLSQVDDGALKWGKHKDQKCNCTSITAIIDCVRSAPTPRREEYRTLSNNCQTDVQLAVDGCCLSGFDTLAAGPFERNHMTDEEREENPLKPVWPRFQWRCGGLL